MCPPVVTITTQQLHIRFNTNKHPVAFLILTFFEQLSNKCVFVLSRRSCLVDPPEENDHET